MFRHKNTNEPKTEGVTIDAEEKKSVEAIFINERKWVTEGASSNIFMVKKGCLYTPPLSEGLLPGTRRQFVLKLSRKLRLPTREKNLRPQDLFKADEIFITSTLKDILPIRLLEGKKIGSQCPGLVTQRLTVAYAQGINQILSQI